MTDKAGEPFGAPDSVITREMMCLQCGAPLRPPGPRSRRPPRFCPGSRCRSKWHQEQRQKLIAEIDTRVEVIRAELEQALLLIEQLRPRK